MVGNESLPRYVPKRSMCKLPCCTAVFVNPDPVVMSPAQFDTLRYVETLISAGVPAPQAEAGVAAITRAFEEWGSGFLATKGGIFDVKSEVFAVKSEITELKSEVGELKSEIAGVRAELKGDIA